MRENYDDENNSEIDTPLNFTELQDINKTKIIPSEEADDIEKKPNYMTEWISIFINIMVFSC